MPDGIEAKRVEYGQDAQPQSRRPLRIGDSEDEGSIKEDEDDGDQQ
jgi:hypothetical protein